MLKKIALITLFGLTPCFANFNDEVNAYKDQEQGLLKSQSEQVNAFSTLSQSAVKNNLAMINQFMGKAQQTYQNTVRHGGKAAEGAMLFISTSMPKNLIITMSMQAAHYHLPVIMRGLVDNSMPKTLQLILNVKALAKKEHLAFAGVSIDPVWFEQFQISAVPALVVTKRPAGCIAEKECPNQPFDVVYGNQSISDSLAEIAKRGSAIPRQVAAHILGEQA